MELRCSRLWRLLTDVGHAVLGFVAAMVGGSLLLSVVTDRGFTNSTGTMRFYDYSIEPIESVDKLAEWLQDVSNALYLKLESEIRRVRESIGKILQL